MGDKNFPLPRFTGIYYLIAYITVIYPPFFIMPSIMSIQMCWRLSSHNMCPLVMSGKSFGNIRPGAQIITEKMEQQKGNFSPKRTRDVTGAQILAKSRINSNTLKQSSKDTNLNKYDKSETCSLSSVMQTNVPQPFKSKLTGTRSGHLSFSGGNWAQTEKYVSGDLNSNHQKNLPKPASRVGKKGHQNLVCAITNLVGSSRRYYCTNLSKDKSLQEGGKAPSNADKLKRAVKDYGMTVVVFHVSISLASLGICYLIVSSGVDISGLQAWFDGSDGQSISSQNESSSPSVDVGSVAAGVSTFVIAYSMHKLFAPARIATTLTCTPFIVKFLRTKGILKTPKQV